MTTFVTYTRSSVRPASGSTQQLKFLFSKSFEIYTHDVRDNKGNAKFDFGLYNFSRSGIMSLFTGSWGIHDL